MTDERADLITDRDGPTEIVLRCESLGEPFDVRIIEEGSGGLVYQEWVAGGLVRRYAPLRQANAPMPSRLRRAP